MTKFALIEALARLLTVLLVCTLATSALSQSIGRHRLRVVNADTERIAGARVRVWKHWPGRSCHDSWLLPTGHADWSSRTDAEGRLVLPRELVDSMPLLVVADEGDLLGHHIMRRTSSRSLDVLVRRYHAATLIVTDEIGGPASGVLLTARDPMHSWPSYGLTGSDGRLRLIEHTSHSGMQLRRVLAKLGNTEIPAKRLAPGFEVSVVLFGHDDVHRKVQLPAGEVRLAVPTSRSAVLSPELREGMDGAQLTIPSATRYALDFSAPLTLGGFKESWKGRLVVTTPHLSVRNHDLDLREAATGHVSLPPGLSLARVDVAFVYGDGLPASDFGLSVEYDSVDHAFSIHEHKEGRRHRFSWSGGIVTTWVDAGRPGRIVLNRPPRSKSVCGRTWPPPDPHAPYAPRGVFRRLPFPALSPGARHHLGTIEITRREPDPGRIEGRVLLVEGETVVFETDQRVALIVGEGVDVIRHQDFIGSLEVSRRGTNTRVFHAKVKLRNRSLPPIQMGDRITRLW